MFEGPLEPLNKEIEELDRLQAQAELSFRLTKRRLMLASISDKEKAYKNPRETFGNLDYEHQWLSRAIEHIVHFFESIKQSGITYSKEEVYIQMLREMKQEILADMKLLEKL